MSDVSIGATMRRVLLGYFGVDSGQVLITDPCYVRGFDNDEYGDGEPGHEAYSYSGACNVTLSDKKGGSIGFGYDGVVSQTGYGDGSYPVYAEIVDDDWIGGGERVARLIIDFGVQPHDHEDVEGHS